jgi:copper resistance protein C
MISRRPRRSVAAVAFATLCLFVVPGLALAHAELDTVTPADKSTVEGTPAKIVMTFTEKLDPAKSSITLVNSGGAIIEGTSSVPSGGDGKEMDFAVNGELQPGAFTIRWTTASAEDGDIARGTTTFTVAAPPPSASPSEAPTASASPTPDASAAPSTAPSVETSSPPSISPSPSPAPSTPTSSTTDLLLPIVIVIVVVVALGFWLLTRRGRAAG